MNVMIIGGTRFMGPFVVQNLAAQGHNVSVFHRGISNTPLPHGVQQINGDRNDPSGLQAAIRQAGPDVLVDMMLLTEHQASELCDMAAGIVKRLVVISSCDVYFNYDCLRGLENGPPDPAPLSENAPLRRKLYPYRDPTMDENHRFYYYDKILVERAALSSAELPATVLRLPMVYGPGDYQHRFYGYIKRMQDNRPAILLGNDEAASRLGRAYCENCAHAISLAACDDSADGNIYNVADQEIITEHEWVRALADIIGWPGRIVHVADDVLPSHLKSGMNFRYHLKIDSTRIRTDLGYRDLIGRPEALRRTVSWETTHPPSNVDPADFDYAREDEFLAGLE